MTQQWALVGFAACAVLLAALDGRRRYLRLIGSLECALGQPEAGSAARRVGLLIERLKGAAALHPRSAQVHAITGLPTREPLLERMGEAASGTLAVLALTDVQRLSAFDPQLGEQVLRNLVDRLLAMVSPARIIAQVDRNHVALWLAADETAARLELDAIVYALRDSMVVDGREIVPEIAIRIAPVADEGLEPATLLTRTLAAFTTPAVAVGVPAIDGQASARDRYQLEQDLRHAVARDQLLLHFQPLIDAVGGRICGAEALIRWRHPTRGFVSPGEFVPVMESAGLAPEMGLWVLNAAIRETAAWRRAGLGRMRVAVNVSAHQIEGGDFDRLVERTLARHSIGPDALEIELTESVAMGDGPVAAALFDSLHALGVKIAIDDFGTGYSSLSTLRTLAFDKIKIDREFVTNVDHRRDSQAICQSIIALGRGLGIRVLAEGVETAGEYGWLRRHGCDHFQGFYFSRPLEGDAFVAFARDRARLARLLARRGGEPGFSERLRA